MQSQRNRYNTNTENSLSDWAHGNRCIRAETDEAQVTDINGHKGLKTKGGYREADSKKQI